MPSIPKGAKLSEDDKKKLEKMKKKGVSKSELSTIRMALLRGHTFRKAKMMWKKKSGDKKKMDRVGKTPSMKEEIVVEEDGEGMK